VAGNDTPAKLSRWAEGRKTDPTDAHSVALVGTRMSGLRPVVTDEQLEVLRLLVDRRRSLGDEHTRKTCQLHGLLLELIPGGAKRDPSAAQAKALLATVRPRDVVGKPAAASRPSWSLTWSGSTPGRRPHTGTSDQSLPGPATAEPRTPLPAAS
jgi:hypothetical protein